MSSLLSSILPSRLRSTTSAKPSTPSRLSKLTTPVLQSLTRRACTHPIYTIVFVLLLASTSYIGLLESSFAAGVAPRHGTGSIDFKALQEGRRSLRVSESTGWKWLEEYSDTPARKGDGIERLGLVTLLFPSGDAPPPRVDDLPKGNMRVVPSTSSSIGLASSVDESLALVAPLKQTESFIKGLKKLNAGSNVESDLSASTQQFWVAKGKVAGVASWRDWAVNAWSEFVDLLRHAETLDIIIMVLGYLSMHSTFVSLFISMRRLGSNFWLAATTLTSSVFAFCFGLLVTSALGVPINMVLLSEGLPFLVVTIGFDKPIVLTKAVLSASKELRKPALQNGDPAHTRTASRGNTNTNTIQHAVQAAVYDKGFAIVRDYATEIAILIAGAASGIQGGLRQFCFLAAWILFFDCVLLFTFYTAILCVKLEITRIKRHVALRRALVEDGVSRRVAENVASSHDWPKLDDGGSTSRAASTIGMFGTWGQMGASVPQFKVLMAGGFVLLNLINLVTIPFRSSGTHPPSAVVGGLHGVLQAPPIDPFKVAEAGLESLHGIAMKDHSDLIVTVYPPIKYQLLSNATLQKIISGEEREEALYHHADAGNRGMETVLKSLDSPLMSSWIVGVLIISLAVNGYLFNAARWSIKDTGADGQDSRHDRARSRSDAKPFKLEPKHIEEDAVDEDDEDDEDEEEDGLLMKNGTAKPKAKPQPRTAAECEDMLKQGKAPLLTDAELLSLAVKGKIAGYALEKTLEDTNVMTRLQSLTRAVKIRRGLVSRTPLTAQTTSLLESSKLPYKNYNYENVHGACCENVIGYLPLPLGVAGPLIIDGQSLYLPMATTEGVLVASTNRGCKAINAGGGAITVLTGDGMTRGPCVGFSTLARAGAAMNWLNSEEGNREMKRAFNSTSRFARLQTMKTALAGTYLYIRFKTTTGDAMGMNMISKGVECALKYMSEEAGFSDMNIISVSGNYCTDKKAAAINWIDGRGKSVVAEAIIPGDVIRKVLKSDVDALVELNTSKNLIGSAMAGSIGGFNAHAANIVAAMFLATGQDPAQVVESGQCITVMKNYNGNLQLSVTMPCIEVGTIGGGTVLEPQQAMLDLLGVKGAHPTSPGENSQKLARIIAASVLAGELSLCSALAAGHLVRAHMAHNRSAVPTRSTTPVISEVSRAARENVNHSNGGLNVPPSLAMSSR